MLTILLKCRLTVDTLLSSLDVDTSVDNERLWSVSYLVIFRRERGMFRHWCWHCSAPLHAVTSGHWSGKYFRPWLSEIFQHPTWQCLLFIPLHWLVVSQFFWLWLTVICSAGLTPHNAPPTTVLIVAVAPLLSRVWSLVFVASCCHWDGETGLDMGCTQLSNWSPL